jgi:GNAT superfamily N-acetyltransferase
MSTQLRIRDLRTEADRRLIEAVYRDILEPSFDDDELDSLEVVVDGLTAAGSYECWGLVALDGDTPAGCILSYPYPACQVLLIGYIAVRPGLRSHGVGGLLLAEARQRWYGQDGCTLVLAEVDDPRYHPAVGDIDPVRRIAFYTRNETQLVAGPYFQPRLEGEGKERVYDMFLAVLSGGEAASVPAAQIVAFLREYFTDSGEDAGWPFADDADGRWLLDWYRSRETVSLQPIGRYAQAEVPRVPGR